jgi:hypothetical protein
MARQMHDRIRTHNSQLTCSSNSPGTSGTLRGMRHVSASPCDLFDATAPSRSAHSHAPLTFSLNEDSSMLPSPRRDRQAPSTYSIERRNSGIGMPSPRGSSADLPSVHLESTRGDATTTHPSTNLPHIRTTHSGDAATGVCGASPRTPSRIPSPRSSRNASPRRGNSFSDAESLEIIRKKEKETAVERALLQARLTSLLGMPRHLKARIWEDSSEPKFNPAYTRRQVRFVLISSS